MPKNDLPQFFEELKVKEKDKTLTLQELLAQFKQHIPSNYLEIKLEEGNYSGSTNPKWKDKPLSERYFFTYQGKEIQLDIPHSLMDKLGLGKRKDIPQPLYLDPQVLDRTETYKGITLQEGEVILVNPYKLVMKNQGIQTEPNEQEFNKLKKVLETQQQNYLDLERQKNGEIAELRAKVQELETKLQQETLTDQEKEVINQLCKAFMGYPRSTSIVNVHDSEEFQQRMNFLTSTYFPSKLGTDFGNLVPLLKGLIRELVKEKSWWDKWMEDGRVFIKPTSHQTVTLFWPSDNFSEEKLWDEIYDSMPGSLRTIKSKIKEKVYQYYRNR